MKNSNRLKTIVSSVLIASSVALINGCCTSHKGGSAYYSSYESTAPATTAQTTTTTAPAAETSGSVTIPLYQENVVVGKREVDAGTVTIKKVVTTETVNQPVELRRETISIDRQPASGQTADSSKAFTDQQYTIQLKKEEPVVEKRVVQTGQVVASKQATTEQTSVQQQIRKEDVAIDKGTAQTSQGGATGPGGESQGGASGTITDVNTLSTTTDTSSMHGRMVQCSNAKVIQVVDPSLIVVGGESGQTRVYVHLQQPIQDIKAGDTVSISGTVKKTSKATDITGGLSSTVSQTLNAQPFFVEAQSCQKN